MKNMPIARKYLLSLIIFIFTLFTGINAYSIYWPTEYTCDCGSHTYSTACSIIDIYSTYSTCGLYTCSTCGLYSYCDLPDLSLPYTVTNKTCLKTGCTDEVCMTDLFQNPLSYFYEYPYGYHAFYLLKPILSGIGEKRDAMGTSDIYIPDMFILGGRKKIDIMGIPNTSMCISPDIFIQSEPAAPPAF